MRHHIHEWRTHALRKNKLNKNNIQLWKKNVFRLESHVFSISIRNALERYLWGRKNKHF